MSRDRHSPIFRFILIYNLSLSPGDELHERLSRLNQRQIECLRAVIDFWLHDEHWGDYCAEELERAGRVLQTLIP